LLPLVGAGAPDKMRVVPAKEILDKIERGEPVVYDHVIVKGDLDLRGLDLPTRRVDRTSNEIEIMGLSEIAMVVSSQIAITHSIIEDMVYFNNIIFNYTVGFYGSNFNGIAEFMGSNFNGTADFRGSEFNGYAYFVGSEFKGDADFRGSEFKGSAAFWDSKFNGDADFEGSEFNGDAAFSGPEFNGAAHSWGSEFNGDANFLFSKFKGSAAFWDSKFNGDANFGYSEFKGSAAFSGSEFNGTAYFWGSEFNGDANFLFSKFKGSAYFWGSEFNYYAYFGGSEFNYYAHFEGSEFNGTADFERSAFNISEFSSAQFNKLVSFSDARFKDSTSFNSSIFKDDALFEGAVFDGPLFLTRAKYDRLYVRWKNIKELGYDDAAFLTLLENFKKLGYLEDYDACYYEYRRLHRDQDWGGGYHSMPLWEEEARKWIDLGLQYTYGYGKKPILPLLWSAGTVLLFAVIWRAFGLCNGNHRGLWEKYGQQGARQTSGRRGWPGELRALGIALLFSATVFLSGTRLFVDPPAMPVFEGRLASHARAFFIAERVLGALFSILFFLAIGGTVVR